MNVKSIALFAAVVIAKARYDGEEYDEDDTAMIIGDYQRPEPIGQDEGNYGASQEGDYGGDQEGDYGEDDQEDDYREDDNSFGASQDGDYAEDQEDDHGEDDQVPQFDFNEGNFGQRHDFDGQQPEENFGQPPNHDEGEDRRGSDRDDGHHLRYFDEEDDHRDSSRNRSDSHHRRDSSEDCHESVTYVDLSCINPNRSELYSFFGTENFIADDGEFSTDCDGDFHVDSMPFISWSEQSETSLKDNLKFFIVSNEDYTVPMEGVLIFEFKAKVQVFGDECAPFPKEMIEENDLRFAAGQIGAMDPISGYGFYFLLTNDRVYGLYERVPNFNDVLHIDSVAFSIVFPMKVRTPDCLEEMQLRFDSSGACVTYEVEGGEPYIIKKIGTIRRHQPFLVLDYGGIETDSDALSVLKIAFGTTSHLDFYPAYKDATCLERAEGLGGKAQVDIGLVRNTNYPTWNPLDPGCALSAIYYDECGAKACDHIWGQGVDMTINEIKIIRA